MSYSQVQNTNILKKLSNNNKYKIYLFTDIVFDKTAKITKIQKQNLKEKGKIAVIDQGQKFIAGYTSLENEVFKDIPAIIFGDHTRVFKYIDFPFCLGADGTKLLEINKKLANSKYIYYFFKTLNIPNTGYNRHFKYLKEIKIPLPPMEVQIKIANALDKAQELINNKKAQLERYDELLQSVFMDIFGNPVTNPKKWKLVEVNKFANIITGNTPSRQEKDNYGEYIEWIKSDNINTPYTYLTEASEYLSEKGILKGRVVEKDSLLMTCIAGSLSCIGNVAITDRKVAFNQQINALVPQNNINLFFMYRLMIEAKKIIQDASTGGMKGMVSKGILSKLKFILPPLPLQRRFASIMEKVENEKKLCEESLKQMEENFNSIMDKAFKGELF